MQFPPLSLNTLPAKEFPDVIHLSILEKASRAAVLAASRGNPVINSNALIQRHLVHATILGS